MKAKTRWRKLVLPCLYLLPLGLVPGFAQAQFLKVGPKAGANLVKMEGKSFEEGFQLGYYAGGFIELRLAKNLYLMPEVLWTDTELSTTTDFRDIYRDLLSIQGLSNIRLKALALPISLNYKVANILALSAGVQFSRQLVENEGFVQSVKTAVKDGDIAAMAGANFHFTKFRVHARYMWGLRDVNNLGGTDQWKQQTAQVGIGFVF